MAWLYVPVAEDLRRDYILSCPTSIAPYVLLNGKPTPQPVWWHGWKKRPWARRLCGMILPHSTLIRGLESWILSLRATRASRSALQENSLEKMTRAISGLTSGGLYAQLCPPMSFAKMSPLTLPADSPPSEKILKDLATELRQESSQRHMSARRIFENGSSFLRNWPTPASAQCKQGQNDPDGKRGQTLAGATREQMWPTTKWATPTTNQGGPDYARTKRRGSGADDLVTQIVKDTRAFFPTPNTIDAKGGTRKGKGQVQLCHITAGPGLPEEDVNNTRGRPQGSLNPAWVEQIMGWVPGQSKFTCSATGLSQWSAHWRLFLFGKN